MTLQKTAQDFTRFVDSCATSPLYARLSRGIADDDALLALAARARPGQPVPNMLFAAVHFLLLNGATHPLAAFYPSVGGTDDSDSLSAFRDFCKKQDGEIGKLLETRRVQTNEVRRCTALMPAFGQLGKTLNVIEIGASAGLNLLWDKYAYDYGNGRKIGNGSLTLTCEMRGNAPLPEEMPTVTGRMGIDLNPVDVTDSEAIVWLRALIWPEHAERMERLTQAIEIVKRDPPELRAGDALELLPQAMADAPDAAALVVYHSFTVNQLSGEMRQRLEEIFHQHAQARDFFVVGLEGAAGLPYPCLSLTTWHDGTPTEETLADADQHGAWLAWRQA